ncbi:hypothetical protein [Flavobacterium sp. SM2513]|uniref:hypothetical protein n=1 Tax=Flavobacterium sp. SM2513 TaxID=3424766 RepID=UPI003D7F4A05
MPSYPYGGFRDGVWGRRTPTTAPAMAFGGFVPLRRLQRWRLGLSYPYDGFSDGVWDFRTPTTASAMAFGTFVHLRRVKRLFLRVS